MPLTEDQQESVNNIRLGCAAMDQALREGAQTVDGLAVLSNLATGGHRPDYDTLSTEDLQKIFDLGIRSTTINNLPDGADPDDPGRIPEPHPYSSSGVQMSGKKTESLSRAELIEGMDALLQHNAYNIDPLIIAEAQAMYANGLSAEMDGRHDRLFQMDLSLQEEAGAEYDNSTIEPEISRLKPQVAAFNQVTERRINEFVNAGLEQKLEHLAQSGPANATEVAEAFETAKAKLNAVNFSGGIKHLTKLETQSLDITGAYLGGVDLSKSDLTGVKIDSQSLSLARGLDKVTGVDRDVLEVAKAQQKLRANEPAVIPGDPAFAPIAPAAKTLTAEDMAELSTNQIKGGMQASETFRVTAASRHILGEGGETLGYAKLQVGERTKLLLTEANAATRALREAGISKETLDRISGSYANMAKYEETLATSKDPVQIAYAADQRTQSLQNIERRLADEMVNVPEDKKASIAELTDRFKSAQIAYNASERADSTTRGAADALFEADRSYAHTGSKEIDSTFLGRSLASYETDRLLGTNVCSEEKLGVSADGGLIGISVAVDGAQVNKITPVELDGRDQLTTRFLETDYTSHEIQKGLYDLEALDYVTGQIDRHPGNIVIDPDTRRLKGIDNDLAFPEVDREQVVARTDKAVANLPLFVHEDTAEKISKITPDELRDTLSKITYPNEPGKSVLTIVEIDGAVKRLGELQDHIGKLKAEGKLVKTFDAATHQQAVDVQMQALRGYGENAGKLAPGQAIDASNIGELDIKCAKCSYVGALEIARIEAQADAQSLGLSRPLNSEVIKAPRSAEFLGAQAAVQQSTEVMATTLQQMEQKFWDLVAEVKQQGNRVAELNYEIARTPGDQTPELRTLNLELKDAEKAQANGLKSLETFQKEKTAVETALWKQTVQPLEQRQAKLEARLDKLRDHPSMLDKLKSLRHGGLEGEIRHLQTQIDAVKLEKQSRLAGADGLEQRNHQERAQIAALEATAPQGVHTAAAQQEPEQAAQQLKPGGNDVEVNETPKADVDGQQPAPHAMDHQEPGKPRAGSVADSLRSPKVEAADGEGIAKKAGHGANDGSVGQVSKLKEKFEQISKEHATSIPSKKAPAPSAGIT
ncbi:MAG TPA: hypothetical protein VD994_07445 [Prosthecobacter sp.]|nr:hypothetical protein [Prosthecobacter sp.]